MVSIEKEKMTKMTKRTSIGGSVKNPFHAQGPTSPRYYSNRVELLSTFKDSIAAVIESKGVTRPINIAVMGQWGIGKTSTLYKFRDILQGEIKGAKIFSSLVPLKPTCCVDADTFSATVLETIFRDYESTIELPQKVRDFISEELDLIHRWKLTKLSLSPELERRQEIIRAINFKDILLRFWNKLRAQEFDLAVIMLDDIHYVLTQGRGEILYDLRTDMQALFAAGARFMFVITGPLTLYPEMRDKAEPFTRLFERFDLIPFDVEGTRELIEKPLEAEGIELTIADEVVQRIYDITGGHPYFITLVMHDLLNKISEDTINIQEFTKVYPDLIDHFARIKFNDDFVRATDAEQAILVQIARSPTPEVSPSDISGRATSKLFERLVNKELIVKTGRGKYRLYNPLFSEYLKRKTSRTAPYSHPPYTESHE